MDCVHPWIKTKKKGIFVMTKNSLLQVFFRRAEAARVRAALRSIKPGDVKVIIERSLDDWAKRSVSAINTMSMKENSTLRDTGVQVNELIDAACSWRSGVLSAPTAGEALLRRQTLTTPWWTDSTLSPKARKQGDSDARLLGNEGRWDSFKRKKVDMVELSAAELSAAETRLVAVSERGSNHYLLLDSFS